MLDIPCVILSGGKSSRMGEDKALLPFKNYATLTQYQYDKLTQIFSKVYISAKTNKFDFIDDSSLIFDNYDISSPMVALQAILYHLQDKKHIFIITVDTPFVEEKTIETLYNNRKNYEIVIAKTVEKTHNLCGVFDTKLLNKINKYILDDNHKINHLIGHCNSFLSLFEDEKQFYNLNTPKEYKNSLNL